jgi:lipopolysaccharide transport system ATP-binding protein
LRHVIEGVARNPLNWFKAKSRQWKRKEEEFWALKDVSFEVKQGEVVGIIGRNGAGKSTLLKILSRITEPTRGRIRLKGRVACLLEVGTGFHPELTGRENIFLNGAILGMSSGEIRQKFDEIVAFSEVEKFLDTPVKRYSSGMYVRLAFAVAGHLEPEILIVDEVLAVGDAAFQKKCLGKMNEVAKHGRTVLFVSHNMPMISNICNQGLMLQNGSVVASGQIRDVVERYLSGLSKFSGLPLAERKDRSGTGEIRATKIDLLNLDGNDLEQVLTGQVLTIRLHYQTESNRLLRDCRVVLVLRRNEQTYLVLSTWMIDKNPLQLQGEGYIDFIVPALPLTAGVYSVDSVFESNEVYDLVVHAAEITVVDGDYFGTGKIRPSQYWQNVGVLVKHSYRVGGREEKSGPLLDASNAVDLLQPL